MTSVRMKSKFASRCHGCEGRIGLGDEIVGHPPAGKRRRWLVFHPGCVGRKPAKAEAWRRNREWMTDEQWDDLVAAMAKQVPPGPPPHRPPPEHERQTAETLELDAELAELMLDPTA